MRNALLLSLLLATAFVSLAPAASAATGCVDVGSGITACGVAIPTACGVSAGVGAATGIVDWKLVSSTEVGSKTFTLHAPAFAGAAAAPCTTASCTTAVLYANGVVVSAPPTLC
jgi:hypothetical protein